MGYYGRYGRKARTFQNNTEHPNNVLNLDKELLRTLLSIQAPSEYEKDMQKFIVEWVADNVPTASCKVDHYGNIMFSKGKSKTFPCVVAHMDEVNDFQTQRTIIELGNLFIGMNAYTGEAAGCPGDDRVGCYTALELLRVIPNIKVAFFVEEEIGGLGSSNCDISFFRDCSFILQADRNGNNEIIADTNGSVVASEEFKKALLPYMKEYDYKFSQGTFTDIGVLANRGVGISCINMGSGYYDAHSEEEKVCLPDVENVLNLMYFFCSFLTKRKWKHKVVHKAYKYYGGTGTFSGSASQFGGLNGTGSRQYEYNAKANKEEATVVKYRPNEDTHDYVVDDDYDDPRDFAVSKYIAEEDIPCSSCVDFNCMSCDFAKH